jgi:hypothetical protein|tara:strand:+ start:1379 stop:1573 length:195 start_codon:yes stop_codon:yes gene_type:complete
MSKVKQYYTDVAEKNVDAIILKLKQKTIDMTTAKNDILAVKDVNLLNIDAENVDEVLHYETQGI